MIRSLAARIAVASAMALLMVTGVGSAAPPRADAIGPVEKKRVTVGFRLPDLGSQGPVWVGLDRGYYRDEGFETVQVVTTEQVREGVAGGSLDFGIETLGTVVDAIQQNAPLVVVSGWHNKEPHYIAVRREIQSVRDLDGKPVLLEGTPGDPRRSLRLQLLKEAGWDLASVRPNYVVVAGGSDTWVRLFLEGRLIMTYFFARQRPAIEEAGHRVLVFKIMEWPNNMMIANEGLLARHPNTAIRFLRATLRAMQFWMDPTNKEYVLAMMERNGFRVAPAARQTYEEGFLGLYYKDLAFLPDGVERHVKMLGMTHPPRFERLANLFYLRRAWRSLGIPPRP